MELFQFNGLQGELTESHCGQYFWKYRAFQGKLIVEAGGGTQTKWFAEYGAKHVIMMDLSHSVDDVVKRNLAEHKNVDVI